MTDSNLPATQKFADPRHEILALLLVTNTEKKPETELAIQAGYAESTAKHQLYKIKASDSFQRALTSAYKAANTGLLPRVLQIRANALTEYEKQPVLAIHRPKLLESVDRIAGVLQEEQVRPNVTNIQNLTVIQGGLRGYLEDVPEAEVVEEGQIEAE